MDRDALIRRGQVVGQWLRSPEWADAWAVYRAKVFKAIENAKTDEATIRGKLMLQVANDVRLHLEGCVKGGEFALQEVKLEEERKRRRWPFAA